MKRGPKAVIALAVAFFIATVALAAATIWTSGPISGRLESTAALTFMLTGVCGFGGGMWADLGGKP